MPAYEQVIKEMAAYIRTELQKLDDIHSLDFNIYIDGRVHDGELKIKFSFGSNYNKGGLVEAGDFNAALREYMRRFGWDMKHKPLELAFDELFSDGSRPSDSI